MAEDEAPTTDDEVPAAQLVQELAAIALQVPAMHDVHEEPPVP